MSKGTYPSCSRVELLQVLSFSIDEPLFIVGTLNAELAWGVGRDMKSISRLVRVFNFISRHDVQSLRRRQNFDPLPLCQQNIYWVSK